MLRFGSAITTTGSTGKTLLLGRPSSSSSSTLLLLRNSRRRSSGKRNHYSRYGQPLLSSSLRDSQQVGQLQKKLGKDTTTITSTSVRTEFSISCNNNNHNNQHLLLSRLPPSRITAPNYSSSILLNSRRYLSTTETTTTTTTATTALSHDNYDEQLKNLMSKEKSLDKCFQEIETILESILHNGAEEDVRLRTSTFEYLLKFDRIRRDGDPKMVTALENAKMAEKIILDWLIKFHQQDQLVGPLHATTFIKPIQRYIKMLAIATDGYTTTNLKEDNPTIVQEATKRILHILDQLEELQANGTLPSSVLSCDTYNTVMQVYAALGDLENTVAIFQRCKTAYESQGNIASMRPNAECYNTIIEACCNSNQQPEQAEYWIQEMYKDYQKNGNTSAQPNEKSFIHLLRAWAAESKSVEKCESILKRMIKLTNPTAKVLPFQPTNQSYNIVIKACIDANQIEKAHYWYHQMQQNGSVGGGAKPNKETMEILSSLERLAAAAAPPATTKKSPSNTTATATATRIREDPIAAPLGTTKKSPPPAAAPPGTTTTKKSPPSSKNYHHRIMALLNKQRERPVDDYLQKIDKTLAYIEGQTNLVMSTKTFSILARHCAFNVTKENSSIEGAEAAEKFIFHYMMNFYKQGRLDGPPTPSIFGLVLQAWVNSAGYSSSSSGRRAEELLDRLLEMERDGVLASSFSVDTQTYNTVMMAYRIHGDLQNVRTVFNRLREQCVYVDDEENAAARPDVVSWTILLSAHAVPTAKTTNNDPDADDDADADAASWQIAETLFSEMQKDYSDGILKEPPNERTYTAMMNVCAKCNQPERSEYWLEELLKAYRGGNRSARPNTRSFSDVLTAWSQSGVDDAGEKCEEILNRMISLFDEEGLPVRPNGISYNLVSMAYARQGQPQQSERIIQRQLEDFEAGNKLAEPNLHSFSSIIHGWALAKEENSGEQAQLVLDRVKELYEDGTLKEGPNSYIYSAVINAWGNLGNHEKAREVYDTMMEDSKQENTNVHFDNAPFNSLLLAYSNAEVVNAGELADVVLEEMKELQLVPNHGTYSALMNVCAKCNQPERSEYWLEEMLKAYRGGNRLAEPNTRSFNTVLTAWYRSGVEDAGEKCEGILNRMISLFDEEGLPWRPNGISYNLVSMAYARNGQPQQSDRIIQKQREDFEAGNKHAELDLRSFSSIIHGWALAKEENSGEQAELVLDRVKELYDDGTLKEGPDTYIYCAVINAWGNLGKHEKAREVYDRMMEDSKQENKNVQFDNAAPFNSLLSAYSNAEIDNAGELADVVLVEMQELQLVPDHETLENARRCWMCSLDHDNPKAEERLEQLQPNNEAQGGL